MLTEIPRIEWVTDEDDKRIREPGKPAWIPIQTSDGQPCKPIIRCMCGELCGIGLHHVHADGTVTASFFHSAEPTFVNNGKTYSHRPGCGWHVFLKLLDYDRGDFPPTD